MFTKAPEPVRSWRELDGGVLAPGSPSFGVGDDELTIAQQGFEARPLRLSGSSSRVLDGEFARAPPLHPFCRNSSTRVDADVHSRRYEYALAPKGKDLVTLITALREWG
jgi:hypothetical protein